LTFTFPVPDTLLAISGLTLNPYSVRGLSLQLSFVDAPTGLRRTINGILRNFSAPQFQKYAAVVSCEDQEAPTLYGVWKGAPVTLTCIPGAVGGADDTGSALVLNMLVDSWQSQRAEWDALSNWSINLLEV
jgi:hypothetical protein